MPIKEQQQTQTEMEFNRNMLSTQLLRSYVDEEETEEEVAETTSKIRILVPLIILAAVGFVGYAWHADKFAISTASNNDIPLIRADRSPIRTAPDDPGGMQVANRDKMVYETIANNVHSDLPKVTRILPNAEEPVVRDELGKTADAAPTNAAVEDSGNAFSQLAPAAGGNAPTAAADDSAQDKPVEMANLGDEIQKRGIMELESGTPEYTAAMKEQAQLREQIRKEHEAEYQTQQAEEAAAQVKAGKPAANTDSPKPAPQNTPAPAPEAAPVPANGVPSPTPKPGSNAATATKPEAKNTAPQQPAPSTAAAATKAPSTVKTASATTELKDITDQDIIRSTPGNAKASAAKAPAAKTQKGFRVQLGSFRSEGEVTTNWQALKTRHTDLLKGLDYETEKADLGTKGVFYRLKVGPFKKEDEARKLCQQLRELNQGCLFVAK